MKDKKNNRQQQKPLEEIVKNAEKPEKPKDEDDWKLEQWLEHSANDLGH